MTIDALLNPFQRFGVHLGLERIQRLLNTLGNPQTKVPIIHVTGTNGKGSVCAYLSSILSAAGYRVGRYTSPHLIDWTERICINDRPIATTELEAVLQQAIAAISPETESPTQFELITAAAWLYFAQQQVDLAVMEVGLGGRLDATNVCDRPLVSVITSISREHWQNLGPTVADIAREKAGILKPGCPAVLGPLPPEAQTVVKAKLAELACPVVWVEPARELRDRSHPPRWATYHGIEYPLPLPGDVQLLNSAIAIATIEFLQQQGNWQICADAIQTGMAKTQWPGRLQWSRWRDRPILIDGAHNRAAAQALRNYVNTLNSPVTWIVGILATKEHDQILGALLRPGDRLHLVPVPDHHSADPNALAQLALEICPTLGVCQPSDDLASALNQAVASTNLIVLCGSLYLVGDFLSRLSSASAQTS